nr:hypothetical protein [uncultured Allomuricauda sp.]
MKEDDKGVNYSINNGSEDTKKKDEVTGNKKKSEDKYDVPDQPQTKLNDGEYQRR